jgi:hypothetical protein
MINNRITVPAAELRDCVLKCVGAASPCFALAELNSVCASTF